MKSRTILALFASAALSGCVLGYGRCLFLDPVRVSLTGTLHWRTYEVDGAAERVAVLHADGSQYVYAPAESRLCQMASDFQLTGWSDYPPNLTDGARVSVAGSLLQATSAHQHTRFLVKLRRIDLLPGLRPPAPAKP